MWGCFRVHFTSTPDAAPGRPALCNTSSAEALGAVLACLSEVLQLPPENATTADGLGLASALVHAALQLAGSDVVLHAQGGVESLLRMLMRCYEVLALAGGESSMAGVLAHHLLDLQAKFCMVRDCWWVGGDGLRRVLSHVMYYWLIRAPTMHMDDDADACPAYHGAHATLLFPAVGDCGWFRGGVDALKRSLPPRLPRGHEVEGCVGDWATGAAACPAAFLGRRGTQQTAVVRAGWCLLSFVQVGVCAHCPHGRNKHASMNNTIHMLMCCARV